MAEIKAVEELTLPYYNKKQYYPVRPSQVFNCRYRTISKLGYGAYSTVWLAWDERMKEYATLKVCIQAHDGDSSRIVNEVNMLRRLEKFAKDFADDDHPGPDFTRLAKDIFQVDGPTGSHYCIVSKPQGHDVRAYQDTLPNGKVPKLLVKAIVHHLLFSLNWLHARCGVAHTDISPQNILMAIEDDSSLRDIEKREKENPSTPVLATDGPAESVVYETRDPYLGFSVHPVLTDFGQMRVVGEQVNRDWWMSDSYRAPEVLLQLPWGYPVDMWSVGVMTLELLEGKNLFDSVDRVHRQYVLPLALAQYIGYLGPPPPELVRQIQNPNIRAHFDTNGNWICEAPIPKSSLEEFVTKFPPGEEKDQFLRFIRTMLTWDPDVRISANNAIMDEWLNRSMSNEEMVDFNFGAL